MAGRITVQAVERARGVRLPRCAGGSPQRRLRARYVAWPAWLAAAVGFAVDAAGKSWAVATLSGRGTVWLWRPWIALRLLRNPGAMLGFASRYPAELTVVAGLAVAGLAIALACWPGARLRSVGLALMLSGAAGNLASRLASGSVVDFIRVYGWPGTFNPADVLLRLGVLLLLWSAVAPGGRRGSAAERVRRGL